MTTISPKEVLLLSFSKLKTIVGKIVENKRKIKEKYGTLHFILIGLVSTMPIPKPNPLDAINNLEQKIPIMVTELTIL